MLSKDVRAKFIKYFESKGHQFVKSSPVVPENDPTLLFANAGMNQFKPIFLGLKSAVVTRAVNSQKCIRAGGKHNDLEEVGKDGYHHTFFEMLGNWSFGDYYKKEAIKWAWELLTQVYRLEKDKLYATVYLTDQEAYNLWQTETDISESHISFHGDKDNFWEMGETGPCGPCSEIHYDRGENSCEKGGNQGHVCSVNGDCSRYIELWNLVFIQYNREADSTLIPLSNSYVDTGAGLERICQVLQNVQSNYDTDLFQPIIKEIARMSNVIYTEETGVSHRVIADHIRCLCFALADGGFPSNEGRGYVLRRILRRAARHGRLLGFHDTFLWKLVDVVTDVMGVHFTELKGREGYIKMLIKAEEERFNRTLDLGLQKFSDIINNSDSKIISGKDAFMLYDTFGFPLDLTQILADENHMQIDIEVFNAEMLQQKERARSSAKFNLNESAIEWHELDNSSDTHFLGYDFLSIEARVQKYSIDDDGKLIVVLDKTPFYAESGGQVSDTGVIESSSFKIAVDEVKKTDQGYLHIGRLIEGMLDNSIASAKIDSNKRKDIMRNHTATHLLHKALKDLLGDNIQQKGSLVSEDHLRFDFAHFAAVNADEIAIIENKINEVIRENRTVTIANMSIDEAKAAGATALFGEKYGDMVRVVSVDQYSKELCGGTHVQTTGEIGMFKIISESSSAAGIRRIEAITGRAAFEYVQSLEKRITIIANKLGASQKTIESKIESLIAEKTVTEHKLKSIELKLINNEVQEILKSTIQLEGCVLVAKLLDNNADLRQYGDVIRQRMVSGIAILFSKNADGVSLICIVSHELTKQYNAGKIVQNITKDLDGKGGGKPDQAMGGGKDISKLLEVMVNIQKYLV